MTIDFKELSKPFAPSDVRWRIQQAWMKNNEPGATCVPYIDNRAVMERLDEVCGPQNWRNSFSAGPAGGVICTIEIRVDGDWIGKSDAAENTNIEEVKGGISDSMKRAAVQWGIGRYLYRSKGPFFVDAFTDRRTGMYYQQANSAKKMPEFSWNPPRVLLTENGAEEMKKENGKPPEKPGKKPAGQSTDTVSKFAKTRAAISNSHDLRQLKRYETAMIDMVDDYTADEFKQLEQAILEKRKELEPAGASA